jgi:hypothetical protein
MSATIPHLRTNLENEPLTGDDLLIADGNPGTPPAVVKAQKLVVESMHRHADARASLTAAEEEAKASPRLDQARDSAALAAGKSVPSAENRLENLAGVGLQVAQRRFDTEGVLLRDRQVALGAAISESHAAWTAAQDEIIRAAEDDALALHQQLGRALDVLAAARSTREGLAKWPEIRLLSHARFFKTNERFERARRLDVQARLDAADAQGQRGSQIVHRDSVSLMAALLREITGKVEHYQAAARRAAGE